jgi:flagellar biosynthetic protein FliO
MEAIQQVTAVAGVLALLLATLWWLRRRGYAAINLGKRPASRRLECVERLSLGPQQTLHLVRLGDQALLVATSAAGCSLVTSLPFVEIAVSAEDAR